MADLGISLVRTLQAGIAHLKASFCPLSKEPESAHVRVLLGLESCDETTLSDYNIRKPQAILSIEPSAACGPLINFKTIPHRAIGLSSLELLLPVLKMLWAHDQAFIPLIVNMSQIPCHSGHDDSMEYEKLELCHRAMLKELLIELSRLRHRTGQMLLIIDQEELLGYKNSALIERLFLNG